MDVLFTLLKSVRERDEGAWCLSWLGCDLCAPRSPHWSALPPGQAPGPHPSPHPPLVPTERRGRTRPNGYDYPIRLAKIIRRRPDRWSTGLLRQVTSKSNK